MACIIIMYSIFLQLNNFFKYIINSNNSQRLVEHKTKRKKYDYIIYSAVKVLNAEHV